MLKALIYNIDMRYSELNETEVRLASNASQAEGRGFESPFPLK